MTAHKQRVLPPDYRPSAVFEKWHRDLPESLPAMDIDQLEYRPNIYGAMVPVGIFELTHSYCQRIPQSCRDGALHRLFVHKGGAQGSLLTTLSTVLKVPAFIFLHNLDLSQIYAYPIRRHDVGWFEVSLERIRKYLVSLKVPEHFQAIQPPDLSNLDTHGYVPKQPDVSSMPSKRLFPGGLS